MLHLNWELFQIIAMMSKVAFELLTIFCARFFTTSSFITTAYLNVCSIYLDYVFTNPMDTLNNFTGPNFW
jgi:hypothetical protein